MTTYHNYIELEDEMKSLWNSHPSLSKLYAIGKTVEERALIVMQISQVYITIIYLRLAKKVPKYLDLLLNFCAGHQPGIQ